MATRRRRPEPPGGGSAALRGALLVAMAVALGVALLASSFDDGGPLVADTSNGGGNGDATTTTTGTGSDGATTTTAPAKDPAAVRVLVLNGVDPRRAIAGAAADTLKAANYTTLAPGDARGTVAASVVYFVAGYDADGAAVASKLGIPPAAVRPLPVPLPTEVSDARDAHVVVVVGPDAPVAGGTSGSGSSTTTTATTTGN